MTDDKPGVLAWWTLAASAAYTWVYLAPMGAGVLLLILFVAVITFFTRQRTGPFPFIFCVMLVLFSAGGFETRVPIQALKRSLGGIDLLAAVFLLITVLLSCEEGLRRFGYRVDRVKPFGVTHQDAGSGPQAHFKSGVLLLSIALIATFALSFLAFDWGERAARSAGAGYVRLGIYAWVIGGVVYLAAFVRNLASVRSAGKVHARLVLLDIAWRTLHGPLRLFVRLKRGQNFE